MRVVDETGKQLGVMDISEALRIAEERNLDLIQVTDKVDPPVCKIMEYGKYLYWQQKKEKEMGKHKGGEVKGIRLSFAISPHDLEVKAKSAEKFLREGNMVRIELILHGREKYLEGFAKGKVSKFLEILNTLIPIKTERDLKKEFGRFIMIISKAQ